MCEVQVIIKEQTGNSNPTGGLWTGKENGNFWVTLKFNQWWPCSPAWLGNITLKDSLISQLYYVKNGLQINAVPEKQFKSYADTAANIEKLFLWEKLNTQKVEKIVSWFMHHPRSQMIDKWSVFLYLYTAHFTSPTVHSCIILK